MATNSALAVKDDSIPSVAQRLNTVRRKLTLVKSTAAAVQKDRTAPRVRAKVAALMAAADDARAEVSRVTSSLALQQLADLPAPADELDRRGRAAIEAVGALMKLPAKDAVPARPEVESWNEQPFIASTVWAARREIGDFGKLHHEVEYLNGLLELLYHAIPDNGTIPEDMNFLAVRDMVADARRRIAAVFSATSVLSNLDEPVDGDENGARR